MKINEKEKYWKRMRGRSGQEWHPRSRGRRRLVNDQQRMFSRKLLVQGRIERMGHSLGKLFRGEGCKQVLTRREDIGGKKWCRGK